MSSSEGSREDEFQVCHDGRFGQRHSRVRKSWRVPNSAKADCHVC